MVKLILAVKRRPDLSVAAWRRHMREVHGPLVRDHPVSRHYLRGYTQCFALDSAYAEQEPPFDATSEFRFDSEADKDAFLSNPRYRAEIFPDGADNADMSRTTFVAATVERRSAEPAIRCPAQSTPSTIRRSRTAPSPRRLSASW